MYDDDVSVGFVIISVVFVSIIVLSILSVN